MGFYSKIHFTRSQNLFEGTFFRGGGFRGGAWGQNVIFLFKFLLFFFQKFEIFLYHLKFKFKPNPRYMSS